VGNMAAGCGEVVVGRARASCAMLSARRCSAAASSWRRLSSANASLGNAKSAKSTKSANAATHAMANADSAAPAANKEPCCSLANAISPNITLHSAASRQRCSSARVVSATKSIAFFIAAAVVPTTHFTCSRAVIRASWIWRRWQQSRRKMVVAVAVRSAWVARSSRRHWQQAAS
jgi:hypothetical protein